MISFAAPLSLSVETASGLCSTSWSLVVHDNASRVFVGSPCYSFAVVDCRS